VTLIPVHNLYSTPQAIDIVRLCTIITVTIQHIIRRTACNLSGLYNIVTVGLQGVGRGRVTVIGSIKVTSPSGADKNKKGVHVGTVHQSLGSGLWSHVCIGERFGLWSFFCGLVGYSDPIGTIG
jgi:hypothetical protein